MSATGDFKKLLRELEEQGWRVEQTPGKGHYKAWPPDPAQQMVTMAGGRSFAGRARDNNIQQLVRSGFIYTRPNAGKKETNGERPADASRTAAQRKADKQDARQTTIGIRRRRFDEVVGLLKERGWSESDILRRAGYRMWHTPSEANDIFRGPRTPNPTYIDRLEKAYGNDEKPGDVIPEMKKGRRGAEEREFGEQLVDAPQPGLPRREPDEAEVTATVAAVSPGHLAAESSLDYHIERARRTGWAFSESAKVIVKRLGRLAHPDLDEALRMMALALEILNPDDEG